MSALETAEPAAPVDLNTAEPIELARVPGLGPVHAGAILASREQAPFAAPLDLVERQLIPVHVYPKIARRVTVPGAKRPGATGVTRRLPRGAGRAIAVSGAVGIALIPVVLLLVALGGEPTPNSAATPGTEETAEAAVTVSSSTASSTATASPPAAPTVSVPLAEPTARVIHVDGKNGLPLRAECSEESVLDATWSNGTEVIVEERGTGTCVGWSLARLEDQRSWVPNTALLTREELTPIVTRVTSRLPDPGTSWAQEYCVDYREAGEYHRVCRTFPTLERAQWTPSDLGKYGTVSYQRLQELADCYINKQKVGRALNPCAFTPVS